ncbi:MAG: nitrite reductase, partial [Mycobacteriaceae bacterium]
RFLFVLDDGRGDLSGRRNDLGLVALDAKRAQLRLGSSRWGPVVTLDEAATTLTALCHTFLQHRGAGLSAAWHLDEIGAFGPTEPPDPRTDVRADPPAYEVTEAHEHVHVPDGVLSPKRVDHLLDTNSADELVVTPWHGVVIPR